MFLDAFTSLSRAFLHFRQQRRWKPDNLCPDVILTFVENSMSALQRQQIFVIRCSSIEKQEIGHLPLDCCLLHASSSTRTIASTGAFFWSFPARGNYESLTSTISFLPSSASALINAIFAAVGQDDGMTPLDTSQVLM